MNLFHFTVANMRNRSQIFVLILVLQVWVLPVAAAEKPKCLPCPEFQKLETDSAAREKQLAAELKQLKTKLEKAEAEDSQDQMGISSSIFIAMAELETLRNKTKTRRAERKRFACVACR